MHDQAKEAMKMCHQLSVLSRILENELWQMERDVPFDCVACLGCSHMFDHFSVHPILLFRGA